MPGILVFSEVDELALDLAPKAAELAESLKIEPQALVLGTDSQSRAARYFQQGIAKVYISSDLLHGFDSGLYTQALLQVIEICQPEIVLLVSTKRGREVAARLAQRLNTACVTNALDIRVENGQVVTARYGLGGATQVSEIIQSKIKVIAVLPQKFESNRPAKSGGEIVPVALKPGKSPLTLVERGEKPRESVDISKASVLVCVGKGLKRKEDLALIQDFARAVKAEVGCTREISSNRGWLSEDRLVGMSGKRCKPKIVFSVGISGQNQFVAGIAGARVSVAINTDANAPIFKTSDYGVVEDLYRLLPVLIQKLK